MLKKKNSLPLLDILKKEQIFYIEEIKEGDIVFDVGANIGELSLLFSRFVGKSGCVHAFEPTPYTYKKLVVLCDLFNCKNLKTNNLAVNNTSGYVTLNTYDEDHATWNSIAERPLADYGINISAPQPMQVQSISLDDYCDKNDIYSLDLLKIDVEGAELNVLEGAARLFEEKRVKLCVFEFGQTIYDMGHSSYDLDAFFSRYDYIVKNVNKAQKKFPFDNKKGVAHFSVHYAKPN